MSETEETTPLVSARADVEKPTMARRLSQSIVSGKEKLGAKLAPSARAIKSGAGMVGNTITASATLVVSGARKSASAVNATMEALHVKYYTVSVLVFGVVFFAAYNATMALQYHFNPDIELEELHAYLVSDKNQIWPKTPELVATLTAMGAWATLMPLLKL